MTTKTHYICDICAKEVVINARGEHKNKLLEGWQHIHLHTANETDPITNHPQNRHFWGHACSQDCVCKLIEDMKEKIQKGQK